jgi:hypothetical protein
MYTKTNEDYSKKDVSFFLHSNISTGAIGMHSQELFCEKNWRGKDVCYVDERLMAGSFASETFKKIGKIDTIAIPDKDSCGGDVKVNRGKKRFLVETAARVIGKKGCKGSGVLECTAEDHMNVEHAGDKPKKLRVLQCTATAKDDPPFAVTVVEKEKKRG